MRHASPTSTAERPPEPRPETSRPANRARNATIAVLATFGAVVLLASVPGSPLSPFLHSEDRSPALLRALAEALGLDALSRDVAAALGAVLLVAAAAAFVWAAREAWRGRLTVGRVIAVGVGLHVLAFVIPLFLSRDVYSYAFYGRIVSEYGLNPYIHTPGAFLNDPFYQLVSHFWVDSPSVYMPGFTALSAGITGALSSPIAVIKAFKLVSALASVGTMLLAVAAARGVRPERAAFAGLLIGWNPVIVFHNVAGGHNDALVGLAVAGAALLLLYRKDLWATAALVAGAMVKAVAVIPLAAVVVASVAARPRGQRTRWLVAHSGVAAVVGLPFVLWWMQPEDPSLGQLELAGRTGWLAPSRFVLVLIRGAVNHTLGEGAGAVAGALVRLTFAITLVVVLVAIFRHLAREPSRLTPELILAAMGWATLFSLMLAPLLLPWYAAWIVPLVWILPRPARTGAIFISVALVITELMAEPTSFPRLWEVMVIWLHWVATPVVLLVLVRMLLELRGRLRMGPGVGSADPLLIEEPVVRSSILLAVDRVLGADGARVPGGSQDGDHRQTARAPGAEP